MPKYSASLENEPEQIQLIIFNLCSHDGSGDYEVLPDRTLYLNLPTMREDILNAGFFIEGVNKELCLARREKLFITIYPVGRILLEGVKPDQPEVAVQILQEILPITISPQ